MPSRWLDKRWLCAVAVAVCAATATPARADHEKSDPNAIRGHFDLGQVQGILAMDRLDGWLLYDYQGKNDIALELVNPAPPISRQWFYLIPRTGQPVALVHRADMARFARVAGTKIPYDSQDDLKRQLAQMLRGMDRVAMEYAPDSGIPQLTLVPAGTAKLVEHAGVTIASSSRLVMLTKSLWRPNGRIAHYLAVHHLTKLKDEALATIARELAAGRQVTDYQIAQQIVAGEKVRGIEGPPPRISSGVRTADPNYVPIASAPKPIAGGDLIVISLAGRVTDAERPIYADLTWVAYAGSSVPARYAKLFGVVAAARDAAVAAIRDNLEKRRPIRGYVPDQAARAVIGKAGFAEKFIHRTGHSLDTDRLGDGTNLDGYETRDTRNLVLGSGFTVGPGIYVPGQFGVRSEIDVYIGMSQKLARPAIEITGPVQHAITPIFAPRR
ncbi:MAG TPA: M24 family metallopeptidase [Kofleriaceae bacterium]|nr:M24 family metallopeptidase [Kofleriaceae bacterium]